MMFKERLTRLLTADDDAPSTTRGGSISAWSSIACGDGHAVGLKEDGTLWAWGDNGDGQLGLGDTGVRDAPTQIGSCSDWARVSCGDYYSIGLKENGSLWAWGNNIDGELGIGDAGA